MNFENTLACTPSLTKMNFGNKLAHTHFDKMNFEIYSHTPILTKNQFKNILPQTLNPKPTHPSLTNEI